MASVLLDDTVDVDIVISDVTNLYSASVHLTFDPALLEVVDANPTRAGVQVIPGNFPGPSEGPGDIVTNAADNSAGTVDYDFTLIDPAPAVNGSGTLATVRFHAKAIGTSAVTLASATLWDPLNEPIAAESDNGTVEVEAAPTNTSTTQPTATPTAGGTTPTPTGTPQATNSPTPGPSPTPGATSTPQPTASPRPPQQVVQAPTPGTLAAAANPTPASKLPSAGDGSLPSQIWRWFFLFGAGILGLATWAFTFRFYVRQKEHERFWHRGA